ncbi:MAG TPA: glycoside hydrolase family 88 protein, partial [Bacteroidales bacterium]|nr:glycoside hydrolase family 88 protein [Bacteroidales bacterium]
MKKSAYILLLLFIPGIILQAKDPAEKVFKPKEIKKVMTRAALWQLENPKHALYDWTNGAFYAGISAAYRTTRDKALLDAMISMGEANQWKPGPRLHHADDHAICQTYIDVYRLKKDPKMINPFIEQMEKFLATPYQTTGIRVITWWWCDALFMAPPAMVKLSMTTGDKKYMEKSNELYHECYDLLYNKEEHLFARDLNYVIKGDSLDRYEANGKKIFWSRGNGWV